METSNRHPADRLADVRQEIKRLGQEEQELRAYLLEHPHDRAGAEHIATIGEQRRSRIDLKALADEVGHSIVPRLTAIAHAAWCDCGNDRHKMTGGRQGSEPGLRYDHARCYAQIPRARR